MVRLLDTESLKPHERADAVAAATRSVRVPAVVDHEVDVRIHATIDYWDLGSDLSLMHRTSSGFSLTRGPRQVRTNAEDRLSLTLLSPGRWRFTQADLERVESSPDWHLILVDQSVPYRFIRSGDGTTFAFGVDRSFLGIDEKDVRATAGVLHRSPLHTFVADHLRHLGPVLDQIPPGRTDTMIGTATTELARALIISALTSGVSAAGLPMDGLLTTSQRYIQGHLTDRALTPAAIARVHNVSVRQLYTAWAENDLSLAAYVMAQRLELARRLLTERGVRSRTISAIATECGFVDLPHFSRRFRAAYGLSPREWRHLTSGQRRRPAANAP